MGKLLFLPMQTENQFKMCMTIARQIRKMYGDQHEMYVLVGKDSQIKVAAMCSFVKAVPFCHPHDQIQKEWLARTGKNKNEIIAKLCEEYVHVWNHGKKTDMIDTMATFYENFLGHITRVYPFVTEIIQSIKPDFIVNSFQVSTPLGIDQNIPYAILLTNSPTFFGGEDLPPPMSDLETDPTIENKKKWSEFFDQVHLLRHCDLKAKFNDWLKAHRCPNLDERMFYLVESPYFNIQLYPDAIDYNIEFPGKWLKLRSSVCNDEIPEPYQISDRLQNLPGKLIYINLGYNQLIYSFVLNKLLTILPFINHRFIISMPLDNNQIASNMYASGDIDPLAALQIVDLVIYHGGTKMMCDTFHFGVPGLVISLYGDQICNGRRLDDTKLGVRLYPNELTKEILENAINKCLSSDLLRKFKEISTRVSKDNGLETVCSEIAKYLDRN